MQQYIQQLLDDIDTATDNVKPFEEKGLSLHNWISAEAEEVNVPSHNLCEWTGINPEMLPPIAMLQHNEVYLLLEALKKMLATHNCHFVLQTEVPEEFQYEAIRQNLNQEVKMKNCHMGFFELCMPGTAERTCALGDYCQCAFYRELYPECNEELTPEEERARILEIEVRHIRKKYGDDWMKYYPYHLDKNYDDENDKPYNYGFEEEQDDDDWWKK